MRNAVDDTRTLDMATLTGLLVGFAVFVTGVLGGQYVGVAIPGALLFILGLFHGMR